MKERDPQEDAHVFVYFLVVFFTVYLLAVLFEMSDLR